MKNELAVASNVIKIIDESRQNALRKVNEELICMYWQVGDFLSRESEKASLPDKNVLQKKLQELINIPQIE